MKDEIVGFIKKDIILDELITLSAYIDSVEINYPTCMDREEMQNLLLKKYRNICSYNNFLKKKLSIDMFEGENKIFEGGRYVDIQPSINWNYYEIQGVKIFQDSNTSINNSLGKKISDITGLGIKFK